jgi:NAD(P)-dependent dehydrogenase (short-subunit alcohol dehydrogenase family)
LAKQFATHGYDLVIAAEDPGIERAARELELSGARVDAVQVDLSIAEGVEELYERAMMLGRIQAAAINAGIGVHGNFASTDRPRGGDAPHRPERALLGAPGQAARPRHGSGRRRPVTSAH